MDNLLQNSIDKLKSSKAPIRDEEGTTSPNSNRIEIPYYPRPLQRHLHDNIKRWSVVVAHRRFGKTFWAINHLLRDALTMRKDNIRLAYIAPTYRQAKTIAWDILKNMSRPVPDIAINETELRIDYPNGARLRLYGAGDDPDALRGQYFDGVVLDEYAQMPASLFGEIIRPALSDRKGYAIWIGTPQGNDLFYDLYQSARVREEAKDSTWMTALFRASETSVIDQDELEDAKTIMTPAEYAQEYECSFTAAIEGSYYGSFMDRAEEEGRLEAVPYETMLPVHTAFDLGISDSTAIIFYQVLRREIRIIDYYEQDGEGLAHYIAYLSRKPYTYGTHTAPHDIMVRELGTGRSRLEQSASLGINFQVAPQIGVADGINAVRTIFPRLWIDKTNCKLLIEAMRNYRREKNRRTGEFKPRPLHDQYSHACDAMRYLAVGFDEQSTTIKSEINRREIVLKQWQSGDATAGY
jgi:hypothetical protein